MTVFHYLQTEAEGIHQINNWAYADAAARTGASGFTANDLYKIALQEDNNSLWLLTAITPTWVEISGSSSVADFTDLGDVPGSYAGYGGYAVAVNVGETALEFVPFPAGGGNYHTTEDAVTADVTNVVTLQHNSTGTPAANFGTGLLIQGESDSTENRNMARIFGSWKTPSDATRLATFNINTYKASVVFESAVIVAPTTTAGLVAGNARGFGAVDLQALRTNAAYVAAGNYSSILGGYGNAINAAAGTSTILGGGYNTIGANAYGAAIVAGKNHTANEVNSVIVGGLNNTNSMENGFIGGGENNELADGGGAQWGAIIGGYGNYSDNSFSGIVGGADNIAGANFGFVGAGRENTINADYGAAFGFNANGTTHASLNLANGSFTSRGDSQLTLVNVRRQVTHTGANWYELFPNPDSSIRLIMPGNCVWVFDILLSGATSGIGKAFGFRIEGVIENSGGTVTLLTSTVTTLYDADDVSFDARVSADDPNNALLVEVSDSDSGGDTVKWVGTVRLAQVVAA